MGENTSSGARLYSTLFKGYPFMLIVYVTSSLPISIHQDLQLHQCNNEKKLPLEKYLSLQTHIDQNRKTIAQKTATKLRKINCVLYCSVLRHLDTQSIRLEEIKVNIFRLSQNLHLQVPAQLAIHSQTQKKSLVRLP